MAQFSYKNYQRTTRTQNTEESFNSGMSYTETPLLEGFLKELVNYNITDNGVSIRPRFGIQTFAEADADNAEAFSANTLLLTGKTCHEANAVQHGQIITGTVSDTKVPGTDLYKGLLTVNTVDDSETESPIDPSLKHRTLLQHAPINAITSAWFSYKRPDKIEAHGITVDNSEKFARPIGSFGFNNSYFAFMDGDAALKGLYKTGYNGDRYTMSRLTAKALTPKEAVSWGYNMLSDNPYNFACRVSTVGSVQLLGILPYDTTDHLVTTPRINTTYRFKLFFDAPIGTKYKLVWEAKSLIETTWTTVKTLDNYVFGAAANENATPVILEYSAPSTSTLVKVTATAYNASNVLDTNPQQVIAVSFTLNPADYNDAANVGQINYDMYKCSGMTYWKNRMVCYGFSEDATVMLFSDVNDPTYFPYPNNVNLFDEPIVYVIPFLEKLLVFTSTKLYQVSLGTDGTSWYTSELQRNLIINDWDIHLTKVVKNMVFFKSGNYYYMVVPKTTSTTGELVLAPISKLIQPYFDHFKSNVLNTLKETYGYRDDITLVHFYNYLDYEDIHNVYVFKMSNGKYVNFCMLYNSVTRYWRLYVYESQSVLIPYTQDATQKGVMMSLFNHSSKLAVQFLGYSTTETVDKYISNSDNALINSELKNYQFLDTGYREHNTQLQKRYRELQFNLNNIDLQKLDFYTSFEIDSVPRREYNKYNVKLVTDPNDSKYGTLILERELFSPVSTPSNALLAESTPTSTGLHVYDDLNHWLLDESVFPYVTLWKVRMPVSGKGYSARVKILSCNESQYEILSLSWIYRTLYSR